MAPGRVRDAVRRVDESQQRHRWSAFPVAVVRKFGDDNGSSLAALITYYALLSVFPLLLVFVTVVGYVAEVDQGLRANLLDSALVNFPVIGSQLRHNIHGLHGNAFAVAVGIVGSIWGSLGVAQAAQRAMADVWNVPMRARPGFLPRLARALGLLVTLFVGVGLTTALTGLVSASGTGAGGPLGLVGALVLNVGFSFLGLRILTPATIPTSQLRPGAVVGGIGWTVLQGFGSYLVVHQLRNTSELYGFFAIVLGLAFWLSLAARIAVYAAEISVVSARRLWPRSLLAPPLTTADRDVLAEEAEEEQRRPEEHVDVRFD